MAAAKRAWEEALGAYLVRRFGLMLLTLFGISVIIFMLLRMTPGNIADILFDAGGFVDPADKARIEAQLGLDKSLPVQYVSWIGGLLQGDLGISYQTERPAIDEIAPRIPITAKLAVIALTFSVLIGVPLGVISAVRQNTKLDYILRVISLSGLSMPAFWLGLLILMAFVAYYRNDPDLHRRARQLLARPADLQRAGRRRRFPQLGAADANDALVDAGGAAPGLHPHGPLEGRLRDHHQLLPRAEERDAAGRHVDRHRGGVPARRADRHRDRLQYSRRRALPGRGGALARLSDGAEPRHVHRDRRRDA